MISEGIYIKILRYLSGCLITKAFFSLPCIFRRGDKESRNKQTRVPRSSALREAPSRVKPAGGASQRYVKQDTSRFSFKCNERAERRREVKVSCFSVNRVIYKDGCVVENSLSCSLKRR